MASLLLRSFGILGTWLDSQWQWAGSDEVVNGAIPTKRASQFQ